MFVYILCHDRVWPPGHKCFIQDPWKQYRNIQPLCDSWTPQNKKVISLLPWPFLGRKNSPATSASWNCLLLLREIWQCQCKFRASLRDNCIVHWNVIQCSPEACLAWRYTTLLLLVSLWCDVNNAEDLFIKHHSTFHYDHPSEENPDIVRTNSHFRFPVGIF